MTGALSGERAVVEIRDQVSSWSQQLVQCLQARSKPGLASFRGKKSDPANGGIWGKLESRINGSTCLTRDEWSARGPMWPEVDEVLGPGRWWPGRLGDEDTRMPGPGPEVVGSSRVAFVRESLPRRASLDRIQGERGPVVVGPVRVGVRCWCRGWPGSVARR